jgi:hypothetical protein
MRTISAGKRLPVMNHDRLPKESLTTFFVELADATKPHARGGCEDHHEVVREMPEERQGGSLFGNASPWTTPTPVVC